MDKYGLVKEIIYFLKYFYVMELNADNTFVRQKITQNLDDVTFVENLISVFNKKQRYKKHMENPDKRRFEAILRDLNRIRDILE